LSDRAAVSSEGIKDDIVWNLDDDLMLVTIVSDARCS